MKCQIASEILHVIFSVSGLPRMPIFVLSPISEDSGPAILSKKCCGRVRMQPFSSRCSASMGPAYHSLNIHSVSKWKYLFCQMGFFCLLAFWIFTRNAFLFISYELGFWAVLLSFCNSEDQQDSAVIAQQGKQHCSNSAGKWRSNFHFIPALLWWCSW